MKVKFIGISLVTVLTLSGCVITDDKIKAKECYVNFVESGSIATGKNYSSYFYLGNEKKVAAFKSVSKYLANDHWYLIYSSEEEGSIKASKQVSFTHRDTPLQIDIQNELNKTKVGISFSTGFGIYTPTASLQADFCDMADYIIVNSK